MPREKSRYREKRSDSYSSDSSYDRKKSKTKHKRRSRSRDRSESSTRKRKRSTSRTRHKRRSYSRSISRERYDSRSKRRSSSRSRSKRSNRRSVSREHSHSRSSSISKSKHAKSKHKSRRRSRSSSSRSSSVETGRQSHIRKVNLDDTESKVEKAIKAAEAVGLTMTKIPTYEYKEVEIKEDMPSIHDRNLLAELNSDSFVQRSFTSSRSKKQQNIVIDLNTDTVKLPDTELKVQTDDSIINYDAIPSEEELEELWIKKLYLYRKKMLKGEI